MGVQAVHKDPPGKLMRPSNLQSIRGARPNGHAFSLVELLVVVVLLSILAALVLPSFTTAGDDSRASAVKLNLRSVRIQLEVYRSEHGGKYPSLADFEDQLTLASDTSGNTAPVGTPGFVKGPYLRAIPNNPATGTSDVSDGPVGSSAWYYDETTGEFLANDSAASLAH